MWTSVSPCAEAVESAVDAGDADNWAEAEEVAAAEVAAFLGEDKWLTAKLGVGGVGVGETALGASGEVAPSELPSWIEAGAYTRFHFSST